MKKKNSLPDQYVKALCLELQERRQQLELSQEDLALQADLHRTYVSLIERKGANFSMQIFFRLTEALNVSPLEVMLAAEKAVKGQKKSR